MVSESDTDAGEQPSAEEMAAAAAAAAMEELAETVRLLTEQQHDSSQQQQQQIDSLTALLNEQTQSAPLSSTSGAKTPGVSPTDRKAHNPPRIYAKPLADAREAELINSMLGKVQLIGSNELYQLQPAKATITKTGTEGKYIFQSDDRLVNYLVQQQVVIKHLISGKQEDNDKAVKWVNDQTIEAINEVVLDHQQRVVNATRHVSALAHLERTAGDDNFITVTCGTSVLEGKVKKDFVASVSNVVFTLGPEDADKCWSSFVQNLASYVENYGLNSAGGYALAISCLGGAAQTFASGQQLSGISFSPFFLALQEMGEKLFQPDVLIDQIQRVRNSYPQDLNTVIAKLQQLNTHLYRRQPLEERLASICAAVKSDLSHVLQIHYPHLLPTIIATEQTLKTAYKVERECLEKAGRPLTDIKSTWHPGTTFLALAIRFCAQCRPLAQRGVEGFKPRRPADIHSVTNRSQRYSGPKYLNAPVASMTGQAGSTRPDFQRNPRGQFTPRGTGPGRGSGRPLGGGHGANGPQARPTQGRPSDRGGAGRVRSFGSPRGGRGATSSISAVGGYSKPATKVTCHNCGLPNHRWDECRRYGGERPGSLKCDRCGGRHTQVCAAFKPVQAARVTKP